MVAPSNSKPSSFTRILTKLDLWFEGTAKKAWKIAPRTTPNADRIFYLNDPGQDANLVTSGASGLGVGSAIPLGAIYIGDGTNIMKPLTNAGAADNGKALVLDNTQPLGAKFIPIGGTGTVTSVGVVPPSAEMNASAAITGSGDITLTWKNQLQRKVFASQQSGTGQPAFIDLTNDHLPVVDLPHGGTANSGMTASALGIVGGDGTKLTQFLAAAGQSWRVNAGGTAIEAYTPGGGGGSGDVVGPASATSGNLASYNGTTGKLIQDASIASSNVALKNNANSWSVAQAPNAAGTIDLGTTALPFRNLIFGGAATNNTKLASGTLTAQRTCTFPDADSNPVQPSSAVANQFMTGISSAGLISRAQPAFSNISGNATIAQGGTNNPSLGVSAVGMYAGDGSKVVQVTGTALQSFRVNAGGTAIEAYTPAGGGGSGDVVGPTSATDSVVAQFDGTTGKLLKNSTVATANIAQVNAANSWSVAQTPNAAGTIDLGSTALPFRNLIIGGAATNNTKLVSATTTAQRTVTFPNADSNTVVPDAGAANNFLTAISSTGVISKAQPSSSNLSDSSNIALRNNANSWSTAQTPNAAGTIDLGSTALPFRNLIIGGAATNNTKLVSATTTAQRTVTFPDANSNTVVPDTGAANNFLTAISSAGVISKAQPAFSNLSGNATIAQGGTNNPSLGVSATGIMAGDGSKVVQVTGTALQSFRVNSAGTAIEAYTPSGSASSIAKLKTTSQSSFSTTLTNDSDLFFSVGANESWCFEVFIAATVTNNAPDIKFTFAGPAGSTIYFESFDTLAGGRTVGPNPVVVALTSTVELGWIVKGSIANGATAGTLNFQWAQNATHASATVVEPGSHLTAIKV